MGEREDRVKSFSTGAKEDFPADFNDFLVEDMVFGSVF